ncbi:hypothetical protein CERSUDRAFT_112385 [Gelatoporia subvermispora B]|uniref:Uncharacterized protein n=1 Tax=Ceriporiopsis subvermispora (strain B) TaxID=914234 RepID=M2R6D7_CERS8|nr:hypothetical protein CERSUDRAFT_112385 [Gelatoporia subvermispora B]
MMMLHSMQEAGYRDTSQQSHPPKRQVHPKVQPGHTSSAQIRRPCSAFYDARRLIIASSRPGKHKHQLVDQITVSRRAAAMRP